MPVVMSIEWAICYFRRTPPATNPTSGPGACTCGKRLVSGGAWLVIAALNSKKSSGTAATGGVLRSDEIPTAVADAGDLIGDNRLSPRS